MMDPADIAVADFKAHFFRDFTYTADVATGVIDADIEKAFTEALANFNPALFSDDTQMQMAFFYLAAHYLCHDLQSASQGSASVSSFPVVSRTVGSVSETYHMPLKIAHDPVLAAYATTRYGMKYLSLIMPLMIGGCAVYTGATTQ